MNTNQRIILLLYAVIIAVMMLFPPYEFEFPGHAVLSSQYGSILSPPRFEDEAYMTIDSIRILVQGVGITLICGALLLFFKGKK